MTTTKVSRVRLIAAFAAIYVIWSSSYLAIRYAVETIPPFVLAGARFLTAGLIVLAIALLRDPAPPTKRDWKHALVIGVLLFVGGNGALAWGQQTVPSGIAALLVSTMTIWMVLIDWARPGGRAQSKWTMAGLLLGLAGVAILVGARGLAGRLDPLGVAVILGAAVSWAAGTIWSKRVAKPRFALGATATQMICGGVVLLLLALMTGEFASFDADAIAARSILGAVYLTLFASVIAFTAYSWLVRTTTPARLGTYAYVNPVLAVVLGWAVADEPITPRTLAAALIIVTAVALITLTARDDG